MARAKATAPVKEARDDAASDPVQFRFTSSRAPYTRGGVRFASNRTPLTFGQSELGEDQLLKLDADTAITIELVVVATGRTATVPHGVFNAAQRGDEAAIKALDELRDALTAPAAEGEGKA